MPRVSIESPDTATMQGSRGDMLFLLSRQMQRMAGEIGELHARSAAAHAERDRAYHALIRKLSLVVALRHGETGSHIERVGAMAALLAELLGESEDYRASIARAAPLHDLGKVLIPDHILCKPAVLDEEQRAVMRLHIEAGILLLEDADFPDLEMARQVIQHHHEMWDGCGYPRGLAGEDIPLCARITTVVDVFDAVSNDRVYRPAMPRDEAIAFMREGAGKKFDPRATQALLDHIEGFRNLQRQVREAHDAAPADAPHRRADALIKRFVAARAKEA